MTKNKSENPIRYRFKHDFMEHMVEYGYRNSNWPAKDEIWGVEKEEPHIEQIRGKLKTNSIQNYDITIRCITKPEKGKLKVLKRTLERFAEIM